MLTFIKQSLSHFHFSQKTGTLFEDNGDEYMYKNMGNVSVRIVRALCDMVCVNLHFSVNVTGTFSILAVMDLLIMA